MADFLYILNSVFEKKKKKFVSTKSLENPFPNFFFFIFKFWNMPAHSFTNSKKAGKEKATKLDNVRKGGR